MSLEEYDPPDNLTLVDKYEWVREARSKVKNYVSTLQLKIADLESKLASLDIEFQASIRERNTAREKLVDFVFKQPPDPPPAEESYIVPAPTKTPAVIQNVLPGMEPMVGDQRRKHTPLQDWIKGATIYCEAIDQAAGVEPEFAKRVIDWGREQKLLKPVFDALGPSELTRRWTIFCQDSNQFLEGRRSFAFFASKVNEYTRPLKRCNAQFLDSRDASCDGKPGVCRSLPGILAMRTTIDKGLALMARSEKE